MSREYINTLYSIGLAEDISSSFLVPEAKGSSVEAYKSQSHGPGPIFVPTDESLWYTPVNIRGSVDLSIAAPSETPDQQFLFPPRISFSRTRPWASPRKNICFSCYYWLCDTVTRVNDIRPISYEFRGKNRKREREYKLDIFFGTTIVWISRWRYANVSNIIFYRFDVDSIIIFWFNSKFAFPNISFSFLSVFD